MKIDEWVFGNVAPTDWPGLLRLVRNGGPADQAELEQRSQRDAPFRRFGRASKEGCWAMSRIRSSKWPRTRRREAFQL